MDDATTGKTGNERLAAHIARALVGEGLVPSGLEAEVREKLASGSVREAAWCVWIESAQEASSEENRDAHAH
jgi:hypothetical protein